MAVIIPALNEEAAIASVIAAIPGQGTSITVVDNGSTDATADRARAAGAQVVEEPRRGYGFACLAGLRTVGDAQVLVFLDGDLSDYPEEMPRLVEPIRRGEADFVLGARDGASRPAHARLGTRMCVALINRLWGTTYSDLGPFRAIRHEALTALGMQDRTWGWTIEMQVKAAEAGLRIQEVAVGQRDRVGESKISGTIGGTVRAGARMLAVIGMLWLTRRRRSRAVERGPTSRRGVGRP